MNGIKNVIQKEEFIAIAINKYILQNLTVPKKLNVVNSKYELDWNEMLNDEYLGSNFNKYNPILKSDILVEFDSKNNAYIKGAITETTEYKEEYKYLYNFYTNKVFRVNTIAPVDITDTNLVNGSLVIYSDLQQKIINLLNDSQSILYPSQNCTEGTYFYELQDDELIYKYCKAASYKIEVYQKEPVYVEEDDDLSYIKSDIGSKAYVRKNGFWYEYYYQGDTNSPWIPTGSGSILTENLDNTTIEDRILSYIPDSKALTIKEAGGCMLANGDIFCWGDNSYKRAGIDTYGQIDTSLSPDFVNTPVMLKVNINDSVRANKKWYNNPYRIKFESMFMNGKNVCGTSPIYDIDGTNEKYGGDLYCNGSVDSMYYETSANSIQTSILSKNKYFAWGKDDFEDNDPQTIKDEEDGGPNYNDRPIRDEIYLTDVAMTSDTIAVLSDDGKIYTLGRNYNGLLGIGSNDKFITQYEPVQVQVDAGVFFDQIFVLRDIDTFGAIDNNKNFWIWGERDGTFLSKPTRLNDGDMQINPDLIFVNSKEFLFQNLSSKVFYRTDGQNDIVSISTSDIPKTAVSATIIEEDGVWKYLYVDEDFDLKGTQALLECRNKRDFRCSAALNIQIFDHALQKLNNESNFLNVSTYKLDATVEEVYENFEGSSSTVNTWTLNTYSDNNFTNLTSSVTPPLYNPTESVSSDDKVRVDPTQVLGRFRIGYQSVDKTYDFGSSYANRDVVLEFDFYEIDSWDMERFNVVINGERYTDDGFIHDDHQEWQDTNDTGIYTLNLGTMYGSNTGRSKYNDEKYHYKIKTKLDSNGKLEVKFRVRELQAGEYGDNSWDFGQALNDESWAIDNIHVKVKEIDKHFTCAITGISTDSQMYCWGVVGRSLPILSTSLYNMYKISTLNKLFISTNADANKQMTLDEFDIDGSLFLKYPTYIGGFDYPFYFK
jgi:hypothetical protein